MASMEKMVRDALLVFGDPVENGVYAGEAKRYFVFSLASFGESFGDDEPLRERWLVNVHLFAPLNENVAARRREVQRALFAAGFTWPNVTDVSDSEARHLVFECEEAEEVDPYGET